MIRYYSHASKSFLCKTLLTPTHTKTPYFNVGLLGSRQHTDFCAPEPLRFTPLTICRTYSTFCMSYTVTLVLGYSIFEPCQSACRPYPLVSSSLLGFHGLGFEGILFLETAGSQLFSRPHHIFGGDPAAPLLTHPHLSASCHGKHSAVARSRNAPPHPKPGRTLAQCGPPGVSSCWTPRQREFRAPP